MTACSLCAADLGPLLADSEHWRLVLNWNQDLLGKCFLASKRHVESAMLLTDVEWTELHGEARAATRRLADAFQPDHFNYVFLQNQDRHVHLHVIPRYAEPRLFDGEAFDDPAYPGHYPVPGFPRMLNADKLGTLAQRLQNAG